MSLNTHYSCKPSIQNDLEIAAMNSSSRISPGNETTWSVAKESTDQKINDIVSGGDLHLSQTTVDSQINLNLKKRPSVFSETTQNKIILCSSCRIQLCHLPKKSNLETISYKKISFKDPSGKHHDVVTEGEFKILDMGRGRLYVQRVGDHNHEMSSDPKAIRRKVL